MKANRARIVFVAGCHNVCNVLVGHRMVQVFRKNLLQIRWLNKNSFEPVKDSESLETLLLGTTTFVPAIIDTPFEVFVVESRASIILTVHPQQFLLLFSLLGNPVETEVVDDAFKVTPTYQNVAPSEVLESVAQVALHVGR